MKSFRNFWPLLLFFILCANVSFGQTDSTTLVNQKEKKHLKDYLHFKLQFAGGIGFISPGVGVAYAKRKIETDIFAGFIPKGIGGEQIEMVTLKNTYFPYKVKLEKYDVTLYPISIGGFVSYSFGSQYETVWPDYYPDGYYWWDSSLRLGFFLGGKVSKPLTDHPLKEISVYYELGSNDLYFISYVQNIKYFEPYEILNLAIGVKVIF